MSWLAGLHALPLLHAVAHEIPHLHIGGAISFVVQGFEHHRHAHTHEEGVRHAHHGPLPGEQAAIPGATEPSGPSQEEPHRGDPPQPPSHGRGDLAHGSAAVLAPVVDVTVSDRIVVLHLHTVRSDDRRSYEPRIVLRARDPPA